MFLGIGMGYSLQAYTRQERLLSVKLPDWQSRLYTIEQS